MPLEFSAAGVVSELPGAGVAEGEAGVAGAPVSVGMSTGGVSGLAFCCGFRDFGASFARSGVPPDVPSWSLREGVSPAAASKVVPPSSEEDWI